MLKRLIALTFFLIIGLPLSLQARQELVLSITGEDVSRVVNQFNQSQSDYHVIIKNQKYRNWRYAINQFRFSQENAIKGASNRVSDIAFIDNNWLAGMIREHWLEDISGNFAQTDNFAIGLTEAATKDDKLYALPFSNKGQVLFYRKDLHQKHDLPLPRTLKQLEQNARFLMAQEKLDHGLTIHYSAIHLDVLPFLWSNGGGIIQNGKVIVNHPSNVQTLTYLKTLAASNILPGPNVFDELKDSYSNAKKLFIDGRSAYIITWNNRVTDFAASKLADKFGILPIPPLDEGQQSFSVIGSWYFAVNAFSKHKKGALQFLNYFFKESTQLDLALNSSGFIPAIKSVYANPLLKDKNPYLVDLEPALANMRHRLRHPREPAISQVLENTIKEILIQGKSVKELLDIAQTRIESICKKSDGQNRR